MRLKDLTVKLNLSLESLQYFIHDFGIDLNFCFTNKLEISPDFENFVNKNIDFIRKYADDKKLNKSIAEIAQTVAFDKDKIVAFFIENGVPENEIEEFKTNISSYLIHYFVGGNYDFLLNDIPKTNWKENSLIGYTDLFFYTTDMLDPFINEDQVKLWGISKPAGIILYGPPGSGKIFWAKKIADLIDYQFVHVYKDYLVNNVKTNSNQFTNYLKTKMNEPKTLLFIEGFEELMAKNSPLKNSPEAVELINSIVRHIQKDNTKELVIVGSVEILGLLGDDITAPGRFDLQIPVFPPGADERAQLIYYHLTNNLDQNSPLLNILKLNKADTIDFWVPIAAEMKLFSNTMVIDFTQSLKKRLYALFRKDETKDIELSMQVLLAAYNEAKAKITTDYLKRCQIFLLEAKQNTETDFPQRFFELQYELDSFGAKKENIRKIGFNIQEEEENLSENI